MIIRSEIFLFPRLTVQNTLPVVVGLHGGQISADPLVVDLVLNIRQKNESGHDTLAAGALELSGDLAVPDVVVIGEESTDTLGRHGHNQIAILGLNLSAVGPVGSAGVTKVLVLGDGIVEVFPGVSLALADRHRGAGIERERGERVATAEAVGTSTTLTIFCIE